MLRITTPARRTLFVVTVLFAILLPLIAYATRRGVSGSDSEPAEIELITLRPAGFEPAEITRGKGAFVLFVDDRSGRENSSLVVQRINGGQLRVIGIRRNKSEWNDVLDLTPGSYILRDASNSELRCQITILP